MRKITTRFLALVLLLGMVLPMVPVSGAAKTLELSQDAYAAADSLFDQIDQMELRATKGAAQTQLTDAAAQLVIASDSYVEGSLERNGDSFTWWTEDGIRCLYSPRMRKIQDDMTQPADTKQNIVVNEPKPTKGGTASGNQVYLVGPYYGQDYDFTDQYKKEARRIATVIGDTDGYTLYSGTAATVDKVAEAVSNGAVVIFDSHGLTDYESGYDYVSGATNSYLCLTSEKGVTQEDYADGAMYFNDGVCVNGAAIANHMTKNSPNGFLWMAICLGMATDTLCDPLREKGVELVYGYSQSVSFAGDYLFEETFWEEMMKGNTVAQSVATMKDTWGQWDWSTTIANYYGYYDGYSTISAARNDYAAFPVVVSGEDAHPGQRNKSGFYGACSLQTVKSTYRLNVVAPIPEPTVVDTPVAGTPYKFGMVQGNVSGGPFYINGEMNSFYMDTTEDDTEALDVYLQDAEGGYYLYTYIGGAKKYINMVVSGTHVNGVYENAPATVYTYDTTAKTVVATVDGALYRFGTRNDRNYTTVGPVKVSFNGFYCQFYVSDGSAEVPDTPENPDIPEIPDEPEQPGENGGVLTIAQAIAMGAAMEHNTFTTAKYAVTGVITEVYNTTYGNMYITDSAGNILTIYGTYDATGEIRYDSMAVKPTAGDTVTIYGVVGQYDGTAQIKNGWIVGHIPGEAPEVDGPTGDYVSISFANKNDRTELTTQKQVWQKNGITVTNHKANSQSDVADYVAPARFYQGSMLTVAFPDMQQIVFHCNTSAYAETLENSIGANGAVVTAGGKDVTVLLASPTDTFVIESFAAQVRMDSIDIYPAQSGDQPDVQPGDLDGKPGVDEDDAIYLLRHLLMGDSFPADQNMDFDKNGVVDEEDAIYLLRHSLMPEIFPL